MRIRGALIVLILGAMLLPMAPTIAQLNVSGGNQNNPGMLTFTSTGAGPFIRLPTASGVSMQYLSAAGSYLSLLTTNNTTTNDIALGNTNGGVVLRLNAGTSIVPGASMLPTDLTWAAGGPSNNFTGVYAGTYNTAANCSDSAGAAACAAATAGTVVMDAAATTVVVSTTNVTANSEIFIQEDSSLGTRLSVTCNTTIARTYAVTARTEATSFTITASAAPITNPACLSYRILN